MTMPDGSTAAPSYGAGLARYLRRSDVMVIEVDRPNRAEHGRRTRVSGTRHELPARRTLCRRSREPGAPQVLKVDLVRHHVTGGAHAARLTSRSL